jgi:Mlc titration factor MtfA (ptsG expression regulator)
MGALRIFGAGNNSIKLSLKNKSLPDSFRQPIVKYFNYYNRLSPADQKEFERRVCNFINNKEFIPMHGLTEVSDEMKALIAASAIQLTLGLKEIYFVHFDKILVFPSKFYSSITRATHIGEVNAGGIIAFSWKDFVKGYIEPEDSYNVGLHEMAHALSLENGIPDGEYHFLDGKKLRQWRILSDAEYEKAKMGFHSSLRRYAFSNREEFLPVCVEYFFEKPLHLKESLPHIYQVLSELLQQDPVNTPVKFMPS